VQAPLEMRIKRVMERDNLSREEIEKREANQFSVEKKAALADFSINNDESELVIPQVLELHREFLSLINKF
jgi:dephospho-CoA kinase